MDSCSDIVIIEDYDQISYNRSDSMELEEQYKKNVELSIPKNENLARSLAKRTSIKSGAALVQDEMSKLIDQMFACSSPNYAPDGRKTYHILELSNIANFFN